MQHSNIPTVEQIKDISHLLMKGVENNQKLISVPSYEAPALLAEDEGSVRAYCNYVSQIQAKPVDSPTSATY